MPVHVANHPIVAAKLTALRNRNTKPVDFRRILKGKPSSSSTTAVLSTHVHTLLITRYAKIWFCIGMHGYLKFSEMSCLWRNSVASQVTIHNFVLVVTQYSYLYLCNTAYTPTDSNNRPSPTPPSLFLTTYISSILPEITFYLGYEATRGLKTVPLPVETPMGIKHEGLELAHTQCIIPILRAGLAMGDGMMELLPDAAVHHIGMYRSKGSLLPIQYYNR